MIIRKMVKKLNSRSGESITETLVALLISALALVMLAGAITAAGRVVTSSKDKLDDYYLENEKVVEVNTDAVTLTDGVKITDASGTVTEHSYSIKYYKNAEFTRNPVISYLTE